MVKVYSFVIFLAVTALVLLGYHTTGVLVRDALVVGYVAITIVVLIKLENDSLIWITISVDKCYILTTFLAGNIKISVYVSRVTKILGLNRITILIIVIYILILAGSHTAVATYVNFTILIPVADVIAIIVVNIATLIEPFAVGPMIVFAGVNRIRLIKIELLARHMVVEADDINHHLITTIVVILSIFIEVKITISVGVIVKEDTSVECNAYNKLSATFASIIGVSEAHILGAIVRLDIKGYAAIMRFKKQIIRFACLKLIKHSKVTV